MFRFFNKISINRELPPGSLVPVENSRNTSLKLCTYDVDNYNVEELANIDDYKPETDKVNWLMFEGLGNIETLEKAGEKFGLNTLILEDIVSVYQRPKYNELDDGFFISIKNLIYDEDTCEVHSEQISLVVSENQVVSFHENDSETLGCIKERLSKSSGRIRKVGADYLAYAICDAVVDNYFFILEKISEKLEDMEEFAVNNPEPEILRTIYSMKRNVLLLKKCTWPLREIISGIERLESPVIKPETTVYIRNLYEHTIQAIDNVEVVRDLTSGMLDIYLNSMSNRMNEIMKVLTIIATIFIPLTFVAGIYGMNFEYMPELKWRYSYFTVMGSMVVMFIGMLYYFRKKDWI